MIAAQSPAYAAVAELARAGALTVVDVGDDDEGTTLRLTAPRDGAHLGDLARGILGALEHAGAPKSAMVELVKSGYLRVTLLPGGEPSRLHLDRPRDPVGMSSLAAGLYAAMVEAHAAGEPWLTVAELESWARRRVLIIGAGDDALGAVVYPLQFVEDGKPVNRALARADDLDEWVRDCVAGGWAIDNRSGVDLAPVEGALYVSTARPAPDMPEPVEPAVEPAAAVDRSEWADPGAPSAGFVALGEAVPDMLRARFPEIAVEAWRWESRLRLRADDRRGVLLVVVDRDRTDMVGRWVTRAEGEGTEFVSSAYGRLHADLAGRLALRTACEDGTPIRADHDRNACAWCGRRWAAHPDAETPDGPAVS